MRDDTGHRAQRPSAFGAATAIFAPAFVLNFGWELVQCFLYVMPRDVGSVWWHCPRASLGDAVLILLVWALGWLILRSPRWFEAPDTRGYAVMIVGGLCIGAAMEWVSVHVLKRWSYGPEMPILPALKIGLLPVLQLALLSPLVFWLASLPARWQRSQGRAATNLRDQVSIWLLAAVALGLPLFVADHDRRPLDDPDLAFQRPGFLDPHGPPSAALRVAEGFPSSGRRAVAFFVRPEQEPSLRLALSKQGSILEDAQIAVVVAGDAVQEFPGVVWIADRAGKLANGFHTRRPRDGGPPVGYAILDRSEQVRYTTLDPGVAQRLKEVRTMLRATP